eukprot:gene11398-12098_t
MVSLGHEGSTMYEAKEKLPTQQQCPQQLSPTSSRKQKTVPSDAVRNDLDPEHEHDHSHNQNPIHIYNREHDHDHKFDCAATNLIQSCALADWGEALEEQCSRRLPSVLCARQWHLIRLFTYLFTMTMTMTTTPIGEKPLGSSAPGGYLASFVLGNGTSLNNGGLSSSPKKTPPSGSPSGKNTPPSSTTPNGKKAPPSKPAMYQKGSSLRMGSTGRAGTFGSRGLGSFGGTTPLIGAMRNRPIAQPSAEQEHTFADLTLTYVRCLENINQQVYSLPGAIDGSAQIPAITDAISNAYVKTNQDIGRMESAMEAGSCAVTCMIIKAAGTLHLIAANAGDCRAVLYSGPPGSKRAIRLTQDHKPHAQVCPTEIARVCNAGGCVLWGRVQGCLAVSRAFGDRALQPYVIADPHVLTRVINPEADSFIYLVSDGVTDIIEDAAGCLIVKEQLSRGASAAQAAAALVQAAYQQGSADNISAVVICIGRRRVPSMLRADSRERRAR